MSMRRTLLAAAVTAGLTACTQADPQPAADAGARTTATAVGTVVGVDPENGTITLQHGPIIELGWPATRMAFAAPPEAIAQAKLGDRVSVDLKLAGGAARITALRK